MARSTPEMLLGATAGAAALLAIAAGCGAHPHRGAGTEIDHGPVLQSVAPAGGLPAEMRRVTIGEVTLAEEPPPAPERAALPVDGGELRRALRTVLRDSKAFDDVKLSEDRDAAGEEHGLVLETEVLKASLRRAGDEESTMGTFVTWFFLGWIGDWQHDQTYKMEVQARFTLRKPNARQPLLRFDATPAKVAEALSMFERRKGAGGVLATVAWYPQFWLESQAAEVTRSLAPACLTSPVKELLDRMTKAVPPPPPPPPPPAGTDLVMRLPPPKPAEPPAPKPAETKPVEKPVPPQPPPVPKKLVYRVLPFAAPPEGFAAQIEPEAGAVLEQPRCDVTLAATLLRPSRDGRITKVRAGGREVGVTPDRRARATLQGLELRDGKPIVVEVFADKRKEWVAVRTIEVKQEEVPAAAGSEKQR